jgi:hypothetical protein
MNATPEKLHKHALDAEKHLEQLATGLAQLGADPGALKAVGQMAEAVRGIAKSLNKVPTEAPAEPAPEQAAPRETMDSAANSLVADVQSNRS